MGSNVHPNTVVEALSVLADYQRAGGKLTCNDHGRPCLYIRGIGWVPEDLCLNCGERP